MIGYSSALAASIQQSFQVGISPAKLWFNGVLSNISRTTVFVSPSTTTYIYINTANGLVSVSNIGYPAASIPISKVVASHDYISSFTDDRPDFLTPGSGGGGTPNFADQEVPAGSINNINVTFTLLNPPNPAASLLLYWNGVLQKAGTDYTLTVQTITFGAAPLTGDTLLAWYRF